MRLKQLLLFSFLVCALSACVTTGNNFPSRTEWIKKNFTKRDDIKLVMGSPFAVGNSGGINTWTYAFYKYQVFGRTLHKELKLYWNKDGSVKYFSFNSSFPEDLTLLNQPSVGDEDLMLGTNVGK